MTGNDPKLDDLVLDPAVRKILLAWAEERDSEIGRMRMKRALLRLGRQQKQQLFRRLAEGSLGILFRILETETVVPQASHEEPISEPRMPPKAQEPTKPPRKNRTPRKRRSP